LEGSAGRDAGRSEDLNELAIGRPEIDDPVTHAGTRLAELRAGFTGTPRPERELSYEDLAEGMNAELRQATSAQVEEMARAVDPHDRKGALAALTWATQFGALESLAPLRRELSPGLDMFGPGGSTLGDALLYLNNRKESFGESRLYARPEPGERTSVILDDVILSRAEREPEFYRELKTAGSLVLPVGWETGASAFRVSNNAEIVAATRQLLREARDIRGDDEPLERALERVLAAPVLSRLRALNPGAGEGVDVTLWNPEKIGTNPDDIARQINGRTGINARALARVIECSPQELRDPAREALLQTIEVFGSRRTMMMLRKIREAMESAAASRGVAPQNIFYFCPRAEKSFSIMTMGHRLANGIPGSQFLYGPESLRQLAGRKNVAVGMVDDLSGSGNSMIRGYIVARAIDSELPIICAPAIATTRSFDAPSTPSPNDQGFR
jgi:hypothetical protein